MTPAGDSRLRPEIAEAMKRLEDEVAHTQKDCKWAPYATDDVIALIAELQRVSLELVFSNARIVERNAEIARLSAPVAGTYLDACKAACPNGCGANIDIGTALSNGRGFSVGHKVHYSKDGLPSANFPCPAPTELEWGDQMARENAGLMLRIAQLVTSEELSRQTVARQAAEVARLSAPAGTWRTGRQVPQNIYEGDEIRLQAHTPEQAERIVRLLNLGSAAAKLDQCL